MKLLSNLDLFGKKVVTAICFCSILFSIPVNVFADAAVYIHDLSEIDGYGQDLKELIESYLGKGSVKVNSYSHKKRGINIKLENSDIASQSTLENTGGQNVDWVIYIGHGRSFSGEIASNLISVEIEKGKWSSAGNKWVFPELFFSSPHWKNLKGVLIFGCAVLDIGDFGWQRTAQAQETYSDCDVEKNLFKRGSNGNYCSNTTSCNPGDVYCTSDAPDPGLKWVDLAKNNNIKHLLGFNYTGPLISQSGNLLLEKFLEKWLSNRQVYYSVLLECLYSSTENCSDIQENVYKTFRNAWEENLKVTKDSNKIERAVISIRNDGKYWYTMGRSNSFINDKDLYWPEDWEFAFGDGNHYLPKNWPAKSKDVNGDLKYDHYMPIETYWKYDPDCNFNDITIKKYPDLYFPLKKLCSLGVIRGYDDGKFKPDLKVIRRDLSKIIHKAAKIEKTNTDKVFQDVNGGMSLNGYTCGEEKDKQSKIDWSYGCIRDIAAQNIIDGHEIEVEGIKKAKFIPGGSTTRAELTKIVVNAFFDDEMSENNTCKNHDNYKIEYGKDLKERGFYCQYIKSAFACDLYRKETDSFSGFGKDEETGEINFGPDQPVTREEVVIVTNRARWLKESGRKKCVK